jgi:hypothetical protein
MFKTNFHFKLINKKLVKGKVNQTFKRVKNYAA